MTDRLSFLIIIKNIVKLVEVQYQTYIPSGL